MKIDWNTVPYGTGMRPGATRQALAGHHLSVVRVETQPDAQFDGRLHRHDNEQLLVMLRGSVTLRIGEERFEATTGALVFFLPVFTTERWRSAKKAQSISRYLVLPASTSFPVGSGVPPWSGNHDSPGLLRTHRAGHGRCRRHRPRHRRGVARGWRCRGGGRPRSRGARGPLRKHVDKVHTAAFDITDEAAVQAAAADVTERVAPVTLLVNNAGVATRVGLPFTRLEACDWSLPWDVNVVGLFTCSKVFAPGMIEAGGGSIVNIASVSGRTGFQTSPPYSATKAAVINLTQVMARDLAKHGIRVNAVCPGHGFYPLL